MAAANADDLLEKRIVLIQGPINDETATEVIAKLLYLNYLDTKAPVWLHVNSPGGSFTAGMAILDTMNSLGPPVCTCCTSDAGGMALVIVAHGAKGHRMALPKARLTFTPVWTPPGSDGVEQQLEKDWQMLIGILVNDTARQPLELRRDMEESRSLNATEACSFGIVDGTAYQPGGIS